MAIIWVTGARGFIGRHLAAHLHAHGHQVAGLGHGAWVEADALAHGVSRWVNGEIEASNLKGLQQLTGAPEIVFHLAGGSSVGAAIASPLEDFRRTVASTVQLMDWIRLESPQTRTVVASSAAVYGAGHPGRIPESAACTPFSPYGHHKHMMEHVCRSYGDAYGVRTAIARLFSVYGAGLTKQLLWDLCGRLAHAEVAELAGGGAEMRDWVDVRDAAAALERAAGLAAPEAPVLNIGTGKATSVRAIAELIADAWPARRRVEFTGARRAGDPESLVADPARLLDLDFSFRVPVEQGAREYVTWYLRQAGEAP